MNCQEAKIIYNGALLVCSNCAIYSAKAYCNYDCWIEMWNRYFQDCIKHNTMKETIKTAVIKQPGCFYLYALKYYYPEHYSTYEKLLLLK
jgi:hypothetical protein